MDLTFLLQLAPNIEHFRIIMYGIVLAMALLESLAFVGLFVPGMIFVLFAGVLAAQGFLDVGDAITSATIGTILGDLVSFYLGMKGINFFGPEKRLFKIELLQTAQSFIKRNGLKSILIGRFTGPLRSFVPFGAGLSRMDPKKFIFWNTLSAVVWAASLVLVGYFFGKALHLIVLWLNRIGIILSGAIVLILLLVFVRYWRERRLKL